MPSLPGDDGILPHFAYLRARVPFFQENDPGRFPEGDPWTAPSLPPAAPRPRESVRRAGLIEGGRRLPQPVSLLIGGVAIGRHFPCEGPSGKAILSMSFARSYQTSVNARFPRREMNFGSAHFVQIAPWEARLYLH